MNAQISKSSSGFPKVGSDLYKCFLRGLVQRSPAASLEKAAKRSEAEIADGIVVRAFSNELRKVGFYSKILPFIARSALGEFGWQAGLEGVNRITGADKRSMGEVVTDAAKNTLFHLPFAAAGSAIGGMNEGKLKSVANFVHSVGAMQDPMSHSKKTRALIDGIGVGVKALTNKKQPAGLGKPDVLTASNDPMAPASYDRLRRTDPRAISAQYFS